LNALSDSRRAAGGRTVIRSTRRKLLAALAALALGLTPVGCGSGRPAGIAEQPGDSFVELSDPAGDLVIDTELKMQVHYRFPDDLPHPDSWFQFVFDVNDGKSGMMVVRKQGRELSEEGDMFATASIAFIKRKAISFGVRVQQSKTKNGPWHDVSERVVMTP
jgi:hypothetical protein